MRKLTYGLTIALLTYSIGIVLTGLLATYRFPHAEKMLTHISLVGETNVMSSVSNGWRRFDVKGQLSFYLPPNVEEMMPPNLPFFDRAFRTKVRNPRTRFLYLGYVYGRRASCETDSISKDRDMELTQMSEVMIGGKKARLNIWRPKPSEFTLHLVWDGMTLCFPDIGHGKKLYFYAAGDIEIARQIFNSIEFQ